MTKKRLMYSTSGSVSSASRLWLRSLGLASISLSHSRVYVLYCFSSKRLVVFARSSSAHLPMTLGSCAYWSWHVMHLAVRTLPACLGFEVERVASLLIEVAVIVTQGMQGFVGYGHAYGHVNGEGPRCVRSKWGLDTSSDALSPLKDKLACGRLPVRLFLLASSKCMRASGTGLGPDTILLKPDPLKTGPSADCNAQGGVNHSLSGLGATTNTPPVPVVAMVLTSMGTCPFTSRKFLWHADWAQYAGLVCDVELIAVTCPQP